MRTRDKPLSAYGVPPEKAQELYEMCEDPENQELLDAAVRMAVPIGLEKAIFYALSHAKGYSGTCRCMEVYCDRKSFYGYKRAAAAQLWSLRRGN